MSNIKIIDNSDALKEAVQRFNGANLGTASELYDEFIRKNTPYLSLKDLLEVGSFKAETKEDIEAIPDEAINAHIARNTNFKSWNELVEAVLIERLKGS